MRRALGRLSGFTASTVVIALSTILAIPLVVRGVGPQAWSDLVVGQAVGTFVGVLTAWGWAVTGPTSIAALPNAERPAFVRRSMRARALLAAPSVAIVVGVVPFVTAGRHVEAVLAAVAAVVGSLGGTWYYLGSGDAPGLLLLDTVPRSAGVLLGASAVALGAPLIAAPALQLIGAAAAVGILGVRVRGARAENEPSILRVLAAQSAGVLTAVASAVYVALPLIVVTRLAPTAVPEFALADRLLRYGVLAAVPVSGVAQSWIPAISTAVKRRARLARRFAVAWGLMGGVAFGLFAPTVGGILAGSRVHLPAQLGAAYAVAAACILASQIVGPAILLSLGLVRVLATSNVVGLVVACTLVPAGAIVDGAVGAGCGLAVSEAVVLGFQLSRTVRPLARRPALGKRLVTLQARTVASTEAAG